MMICIPTLMLFKALFICIVKYEPVAHIFPHTSKYEIAQGAISMVHTYTIVTLPWVIDISKHFDWITSFGFTYFVWDSLVILLYTFKTKKHYLVHHVVSLFILYGCFSHINIYNVAVAQDLYYYAEFSNLFLTPWTLSRQNKAVSDLHTQIVPFLAATYIPARLIAVPWHSLMTMWDIYARRGFDYVSLYLPYIFLAGMSAYYSIVIWQIFIISRHH
jgi:hypothetical protein